MCICFVFEVLLLVDMSLLVLSGPRPILNLKFTLLFQMWWSLSILSRHIWWPSNGILSTYRHYLAPALSRVFYHFSNSHKRRFLGFFSACCKCNLIVFWISSFTIWSHESRAVCSRSIPISGGKQCYGICSLWLSHLRTQQSGMGLPTKYSQITWVERAYTSAQGS